MKTGSLKLNTLVASALVSVFVSGVAGAEPGKFKFQEKGSAAHPDMSAHIIEMARAYRDRPEQTRGILAGKPESFRKLIEYLGDKDLGLVDAYDKASAVKDPFAKGKAIEALHERFWKTMDGEEVAKRLGGTSDVGKVNGQFTEALKAWAVLPENAGRKDALIAAATQHVALTSKEADVSKTVASAAQMKLDSYGADVKALIQSDRRPTPEAMSALTVLFGHLREAVENGVEGQPKLTKEEKTNVDAYLDYVLLHEKPADMTAASGFLTNMFKQGDRATSFKALEIILNPSREASQSVLVAEAKAAGVNMEAIRAEIVAKLKAEGIEKPTEEQITRAMSLLKVRELIESALKAKGGEKEVAAFRERLQKASDEALMKNLEKLAQDKSKAKALEELMNANNKPKCVPKSVLDACAKLCATIPALAFLAPFAMGEKAAASEGTSGADLTDRRQTTQPVSTTGTTVVAPETHGTKPVVAPTIAPPSRTRKNVE